jgi:hypothetical protein
MTHCGHVKRTDPDTAPYQRLARLVVKVVFPDGREKRVSRFLTEEEAKAWIANESDDWLAGIGEGR